MREEPIVCKRCGKCCYMTYKGITKKCRYLITLKPNKTLCRIYNNNRLGRHIGTILGLKFFCCLRETVHFNYEGCPYNRPEWEKEVIPTTTPKKEC